MPEILPAGFPKGPIGSGGQELTQEPLSVGQEAGVRGTEDNAGGR